MIGVGQLVALGRQIASSFMSEQQIAQSVPDVDRNAEPVAVSIDVDQGRVRSAVVLPAAVLKIGASFGGRAVGGGAPAEDEAP